MGFKRIAVRNFKSFKELRLDLGNFNVLIGANASGKSNFVDIFRFLKNIAAHGPDNAISMLGEEYIRNVKCGNDDELSVEVLLDTPVTVYLEDEKVEIAFEDVLYNFTLRFQKRREEFRWRVARESVDVRSVYYSGKKKVGEAKIAVRRGDNRVNIDITEKEGEVPLKKEDLNPPFPTISEDTLIVHSPLFIAPVLFTEFLRIGIYDFDPKLPKSAIPITGMATLEEDGENLPIILKRILEDPERKEKLHTLIRDLLPFVEDIDVERFTDSSLLVKLKESYYPESFLPAPFISDGTINVIALLAALFFERVNTVIVEEPERNIHPYLIERVVDLMREASENRQLIITTHNPEVVKHTGIEPLLLVSRDREGFSTVKRAIDIKEIEVFLRNEIGLDELYVQNLLEG